jgi:hypothetical protein
MRQGRFKDSPASARLLIVTGIETATGIAREAHGTDMPCIVTIYVERNVLLAVCLVPYKSLSYSLLQRVA